MLRQEYYLFMKKYFSYLIPEKPLFYTTDYGLRFNLQVGEAGTDPYFDTVLARTTTLFDAVFEPSDNFFLVLIDWKYKRRKIRKKNFVFKQIVNIDNSNIYYKKAKKQYGYKINQAVLKINKISLDYKSILTAIAYTDFSKKTPRLDSHKGFTDKEIYFIHIDKKIIFHMYDDRGLDIVASDIETLKPLYKTYNNWLLDYDREQIDQLFI